MRRRLPRIHTERGEISAPRSRRGFEKFVSPTYSKVTMPRQNAVESLIELTLEQAKKRHRPEELKDIHNEMRKLYRDLVDELFELLPHRRIDITELKFHVDALIIDAYLLGSASPNPTTDRTAKALLARQKMRKERAPALPPWKEYANNRLPTMKKRTALARAKSLKSELEKKKIKPPALSTLRQYVGQVDRQRTFPVSR
jgi:hypothetical protein